MVVTCIINDEFCNKNDEFCIANDELCNKHDEFCIANDEFCNKNDEFCNKNDEFYSRRVLPTRTSCWHPSPVATTAAISVA